MDIGGTIPFHSASTSSLARCVGWSTQGPARFIIPSCAAIPQRARRRRQCAQSASRCVQIVRVHSRVWRKCMPPCLHHSIDRSGPTTAGQPRGTSNQKREGPGQSPISSHYSASPASAKMTLCCRRRTCPRRCRAVASCATHLVRAPPNCNKDPYEIDGPHTCLLVVVCFLPNPMSSTGLPEPASTPLVCGGAPPTSPSACVSHVVLLPACRRSRAPRDPT